MGLRGGVMKKLLILFMLVGFSSSICWGSSTATVCDNANDCKLLLHMNGTTTTFVDTALSKTVSQYGDTTQTDTNAKFTKSALFDGTGDYLSIPHSADWDFGSGNFTIDFWVRFAALPSSGVVWEFFSQITSAPLYAWQSLIYNNSGAYEVYFQVSADGSNITNHYSSWTPSINTWYHIAFIRNGNDLKFFIDGTQLGATKDMTGFTIYDSSLPLTIGTGGADYAANALFNGMIDELRIVKGTAVWTSNFTSPVAEYTLSSSAGFFQLIN